MATIKKQKTDKQYFLDNSEDGFDFYEYILGDLKMAEQGRCENVLNPFYADKNPSLSIYFSYEMWYFKDHGDPAYAGDVFAFAGWHYDLDPKKHFKTILLKMFQDLNIEIPSEEVEIDDSIFDFGYTLPAEGFHDSDGANKAHEYFKQFGISKKVLKQFRVRALLSSFYCIDKNDDLKEWRINKDQLTIAYEDINHFKLYRPGAQQFKFQYFGNKPKDFVFGQKEIIRDMVRTKKWERDLLILAAGEKDVMTLVSLGYDAICMNSETITYIPDQLQNSILICYKRIMVMYDNDYTGRKSSGALHYKYGFEEFELPEELKEKGGKDVSDYVQLGLNIDTLHERILGSSVDKVEEIIKISSPPIVKPDDKNTSTKSSVVNLNSDQALDELMSESGNNLTSIQELSTPLLDNKIFNLLPNPLKEICAQFSDPRERDVVFLSSMVMISTLFPSLKSINSSKTLGANLSLFITAPAASGKGVADWGRYCGKSVQKSLREQYMKEVQSFQAAKSGSMKELKNEDEVLQKPIRKSLFIPANTSVSKIMEMLAANERFGIIFETEGDTLSGALKTEWGNFSDIIRRCFHHETLSLARKGNDEFIEVDNPHLSILLTGTPKQVSNLIDSVENGFFSRLMFYDFHANPVWKSQLSKYNRPPLDIFFETVAEQFYTIWVNHEKVSDTFVTFTDDQIFRIDEFFKNKQELLLRIYGQDIIASVHRSGVVCQRITMILSALRFLENNKILPQTLLVSEQDLDTSLNIIDTLLDHLQIVFARMKGNNIGNKLNFQQRRLWDTLPSEFSRKDYDATVSNLGIENKTGEKYIADFQKKQLLIRIKHGYYNKAA
jgi:hypothetical protein